MNFIVTGGAGFIGSHIAEYLVEQNHSVTIIDNFHTAKLENLSRFRNKIEILKMDILDYEKLKSAVKNADGVFHE
ncbi:MAG TPA: SDR family NAD(P)-dependent oxidoreductase, partial [Nitrosopumilaceae archaeon]|nr:SDR family NAD(P)-dependent oxidoreductase [Nitrosopumilaceae archaeon]